jgi:hypothetical protein
MAKKRRAECGQRDSGVRDDDLRHLARNLDRMLDHDCGRPLTEGLGDKRMSVVVRTANGDEDRAGPDGLRMVGNPRHRTSDRSAHLRGRELA